MRRLWILGAIVAVVLLGLIAGRLGTTAQDATPATADHPLVGTWITDTDTSLTTDAPEIAVWGADGSFIDAGAGFSGVWEPTGPRTAAHTFVDAFADGGGGYFAVSSTIEVDATGDGWSSPYAFMTVGADGTVLATGQATSRGTRLPVVPLEAIGTPLAGFPTWPPAPPAATPAP